MHIQICMHANEEAINLLDTEIMMGYERSNKVQAHVKSYTGCHHIYNSKISKPNQNQATSSKPSETKDSNLSVRVSDYFEHTRCLTVHQAR